MHTPTQPELVNFWRSAPDRPNILVLAPTEASYTENLQSLREGENPCEVVVVESWPDASRLLRRGNIALLVIPGQPAEPGALELMIEGLNKEQAPRVLVMSSAALTTRLNIPQWIRIANCSIERSQLRRMVQIITDEFEDGGGAKGVSLRELLEAAAHFPDEAWIRVSNGSGEFGDLCIRDGRIVYCEVARLSGAEAVLHLLSWKSCVFEYRSLPGFLAQNMDQRLAELSQLTTGAPPAAAPPPVPAQAASRPPSPPAPELEEPTDFPSLAQFASSIAAESAPSPNLSSDIEEPLGLPEFSAMSFDTFEDLEDEPQEPVFDFTVAESPAAPNFIRQSETGQSRFSEFPAVVHMPSRPGEFRVTDSLFAAVAILSSNKTEIESCMPASDASYFDATALRDLYSRARLYAQTHRLGPPLTVFIGAGDHSIAVAPIPGGERLVAVRLRSSRFGELEEIELKRLQESLLNYPVTSA